MFADGTQYYSVEYNYRPSIWRTKPNYITDVDEFNKIIKEGQAIGNKLDLTSNGAIRQSRFRRNGWFWDNFNQTISKNTFAIAALYQDRVYYFIFWPGRDETKQYGIKGGQSLKLFKKFCGDLAEPFAKTDKEEIQKIKDKIHKPSIEMMHNSYKDVVWDNVFHIDIHSAYPAFLCKAYPQFRFYFHDYLYVHRKEHPENKCYLNYSVGAMQSLKIPGKVYPELSLAGVNGTYDYVMELIIKLKKAGFIPIATNSDGIFYYSPTGKPYHDDNEGTDMGQWSTDHHFEKIRFKSAGSYEYIENGEYHAVVRGIPKKLSDTFVWGDIYKHHPRNYILLEDRVIEKEVSEEEVDWNEIDFE